MHSLHMHGVAPACRIRCTCAEHAPTHSCFQHWPHVHSRLLSSLQALGVRVGRVLSVAEAGAEQALPFPQPARAKMAMAEGFAGAPVNMGDGAVEATVWVTFELEGGEL